MTLNQEAKKILLRKIPHGLFICGVRDEEKDEVNGFTALPNPEFWNITTGKPPPRYTPAAMPTASPSLTAGMYDNLSDSIDALIRGFKNEQGTPV